VRANVVWIAAAAAATLAMSWLGLYGFGWNDYEVEALGSIESLVHGHLGSFFAAAPVYGGSLLERAPFALAPSLWGGGDLAVYRMMALPCLLAGAGLGLWLRARVRSQGGGLLTQAVVLALCVANPLTLAALEIGHPDELLGGSLCVTAVLLAARGRPAWAGLALGAAFANKQWAVLALGPVLLALPGRRMLCVSVAAAVGGALLAPFFLFAPGSFTAATQVAASPDSRIFQPWQLWWFLGHHGHVVRGLFGAIKPGYRTAPGWIGPISHPLIVMVALPLVGGAWLRLRSAARHGAPAGAGQPEGGAREGSALLLLALLLLLRCMLDTWDVVYYPLPFVLALGAWEALALRRVPVLAFASSVAVWAEWLWLPSFASADIQAAFFAAWSVPLASGLALALYAPGRLAALVHRGEALGRPREHLVPALGDER
jgi:hypothetical protein